MVSGTLSRSGRKYAAGTAREGTTLTLKAIRHLTQGRYRLALTYKHHTPVYDTVHVLIKP